MIDTAGFTGTSCYYKHWLGFKFTDGVKYVAETCKAFWLLDVIASWQPEVKARHGVQDFQTWKLSKKGEGWIVRCEDGNNNYLCSQEIPLSDFPDEDGVEIWLINGVMIVPSEY
jgi:hypothetical protein